jgi:hypothetical protein
VGGTTSPDVGAEEPVGGAAPVLGADAEVLAVDVGASDVVDRAVGFDESPPRVTNTVTATAITTRTRVPMASRPHRGPFGGFGRPADTGPADSPADTGGGVPAVPMHRHRAAGVNQARVWSAIEGPTARLVAVA